MSFLGLHLGWPTIKSSTAVLICIVLFIFIFNDNPVLSCLASVYALREDIKTSIFQGYGRIVSIILASLITIFLIIIFPISSGQDKVLILIVPLAIMIFIPLVVRLNLHHGVFVGIATLLIIFFSIPAEKQVLYAFTRVSQTIVGVVVAIIVNYALPNNHLNNSEK